MANDGITAKFPTATVALTDFGGSHPPLSAPTTLVLQTSLAAGDTSVVSTTTIPASFPAAGWITIDAEIIKYTSFAAATFTVTRGAQQTVAASHTANANIGLWFTPQEMNQIEAELVALETQIGVGYYAGESTGRWLWDWDGKAAIESTLVGSGVYAIAPVLNTYTQFGTGATSASSSAGRIQIGSGGTTQNGVGKLRFAKFHYQYGQIDANVNSKVYITDESVVGNPSDTARHIGIRQTGASLFFSTGDNTTEQATDISASFTASADAFVDITYDGTTARCYVNGTLKATQSTNVPATASAVPPIFRVYVVNSAAAAKNIYFTKTHLVLSF